MIRVTCPNPDCGWSADLNAAQTPAQTRCPTCGERLRARLEVPAEPGLDTPRLTLRGLVEGGHITFSGVAGRVVVFECTHEDCRARSIARPDRAGKAALCPNCGRSVVVNPVPRPRRPERAQDYVSIVCSVCGGRLRVRRALAGHHVRCAHCSQRTIVPSRYAPAPVQVPPGPAPPSGDRAHPPGESPPLTSAVETPTAPRLAATAPVAPEPVATPSGPLPVSPPDADRGSDPDPSSDPGLPPAERPVDDDFSFDADEAARPTRGRPPAKRTNGFGTNEMEHWKDD